MRTSTFEAFMAEGPTTRAWLLDRVLPATGLVIVAGPPHAGKSRLLVALAAAVESGDAGFGGVKLGDVPRGRPVLLVAAEHDAASWRMLLDAAARGAYLESLSMVILRPPLDLAGEDFAELARQVEQLDPWVVIVDSLRSASSVEENDSGSAAELMRRLAGIAGSRLVVAVHHEGHNGRLRGSTHWTASADAVVLVDRQGDRVTLRAASHDGPDVTVRVRMTHDAAGALRFEAAGDAARGEEDERERRALLDALASGPLSGRRVIAAARDLASDRGMKLRRDEVLRGHLPAMAADGLVEQVPDHKWKRVEGGERSAA